MAKPKRRTRMKSAARKKARRPAKMTPEQLRMEFRKLRGAVTALQVKFKNVPDKQVIARPLRVVTPEGKTKPTPTPIIDYCLPSRIKPTPIPTPAPMIDYCLLAGKDPIHAPVIDYCLAAFFIGVKASTYKRSLAGIGLTLDFLIELIELSEIGSRSPRKR
jgi:hypothetical protein